LELRTTRIDVGFKKGVKDARGDGVCSQIKDFLNISVDSVETRNIYTLESRLDDKDIQLAKDELFTDKIIHDSTVDQNLDAEEFDYAINVSFKPGVTDNIGRTTKQALEEILGKSLPEDERATSNIQYLLRGVKSEQDAQKIAQGLLANNLIETATIQSYEDWQQRGTFIPDNKITSKKQPELKEYNLEVSDEELIELSEKGCLSLQLKEMKTIRDYFRKKQRNPTDIEIEMLAQTWSEHCQHKIFNAKITYTDTTKETTEKIDSLFKTYIKKATKEIDVDWLVSVFDDNAGVIKFNDRLCLVYKVETHNSPSALDPFGGAMTGIVGVNRDPAGTGLGAKLLFNVWGYCFGDPFVEKAISSKLLHPRRIRDGVHKGVIDGANQSGIPYTRGWEIFDYRNSGKPLVFCGTLGILPYEIAGKLAHTKESDPGDYIIMVGGRVGKDGIHGATFSSVELSDESPIQAVQIGDPITQKKMTDFLLEARDLGYVKLITDNGAGGLSSSVGETALMAGGCEVDLDTVPLKYHGMDYWEIWISEAQERMTVGVDPKHLDDFIALSKKRSVESTVIGNYTNSGKCVVKAQGKTIADIDLEFLHNGSPQYELKATWIPPKKLKKPNIIPPRNLKKTLKSMLARLNICSGEKKARQYDHEVKGLSVIKPFVGKHSDVPSDATVSFVEYGSKQGVIMAEGVNPFFSDIDTYWMAASVLDEAVRRVIAVGGKLDTIAALDNFCWPRSIPDDFKQYTPEQLADFEHKLAQLVRANKSLYEFTKAYGTPLISGKDSMFNDCTKVDPPISIPPTLLLSVIAKMHDVSKAVTMDVKQPGDIIYVLGETHDELGGSEFYRYIGDSCCSKKPFVGNKVPELNSEKALRLYNTLSQATEQELVHSIHTPTKGGLGVALAKTAFAGDQGITIILSDIPSSIDEEENYRDHKLLFSESNSRFIVTVPQQNVERFNHVMQGNVYNKIGEVRPDKSFVVYSNMSQLINSNINNLKKAWQSTLKEI